MSDVIYRQDAINTALEFFVEFLGGAFHEKDQKTLLQRMNDLPSIETEQDREFMKLTVRNSNDRPYYSIIYLEVDDNGVGHDFEGYSSYSLDVISDYLKKYFIPSAEPEIIRCRDCVKREICRTTNIWAVAPDDDWFCGDAERRTDEGE